MDSSPDLAPAARLPALIDSARSRLAEARTSAEVLEGRAAAQAALHYARLTKAANDTQADCTRMIVRAEMRVARELDAAQERGEVARQNQPVSQYVRKPDIPPATFADLGLDRRRVAEWRDTARVGEAVVESAINGALAQGRPPRRADIAKAVKRHRGAPPAAPPPDPNLQRHVGKLLDAIACLGACAEYWPEPGDAPRALAGIANWRAQMIGAAAWLSAAASTLEPAP